MQVTVKPEDTNDLARGSTVLLDCEDVTYVVNFIPRDHKPVLCWSL